MRVLSNQLLSKIDNGYGWPGPATPQYASDREEIVEIMAQRRLFGLRLFNVGDSWNEQQPDRLACMATLVGNGSTSRMGKGSSPGPREIIFDGALQRSGDRMESAKVKTWEFTIPGHGIMVRSGYTKGEARTRCKEALGIKHKDRLPIGTTSRLLPGGADAAQSA
jgi:hypothetical protein